jgi:hypothetical protein
MILLSAQPPAQLMEDQMSKPKGPDSTRSRGIAKEKIVPVAEGSQQPRAPGWVAPGSANVQSANLEQQGAALRARGSLQGSVDANLGTQRGGPGAQQAGWSARQSAQRMQARGEEDRLNASRQSGYGGMGQQGGSLESSTGSMQSDANMPRQGDQTAQPASDYRSKKSKKGSKGAGH